MKWTAEPRLAAAVQVIPLRHFLRPDFGGLLARSEMSADMSNIDSCIRAAHPSSRKMEVQCHMVHQNGILLQLPRLKVDASHSRTATFVLRSQSPARAG